MLSVASWTATEQFVGLRVVGLMDGAVHTRTPSLFCMSRLVQQYGHHKPWGRRSRAIRAPYRSVAVDRCKPISGLQELALAKSLRQVRRRRQTRKGRSTTIKSVFLTGLGGCD